MKTALITGATSGIGYEFAKQLADRGFGLIVVGRRVERLQELKESLSVPVEVIKADLNNREECFGLLEKVADKDIDVFINNAGFGLCGKFVETDVNREVSMVQVNDIAMHILFKGILKQMDKAGKGQILNVASSAGILPAGPYMATYYASKAYVVSLTRAVDVELKEAGSGVKVSALCPGPVDTEFNDTADVVFALKGISASQCVREALKGMDKGKTIIVPSLRMKLAMAFQAIVPMPILVKLTARQQKKKMD